MKVCKRILAGLTLVVAMAMLLLSLAAGIGVWLLKEPVTSRAMHTFGRIDAAFGVVDQGLEQVKGSLARAAERLDNVREEQRQLAPEPQKANATRRLMARTVQQRLAPEVGDAQAKLHTVAEAAVVVNSVLEDMGNLPFLDATGLDLGQLSALNNQLTSVSTSAWELSRLFAEPEPTADDVNSQLSRIDQTLKTMQTVIAGYETRFVQIRSQTQELKSRALGWITPVVAIISAVCLWIALSQVSMLCHAWSWWKRS
jgi:hypothetical protein